MNNVATTTVTLLTAAVDDETFSQPIDVRGYTHIVFYIICTGTVSSGAVTFEEAPIDPATKLPYGDPSKWAAIGTAVSPTSAAGISATHIAVGAYSHIHARVSTVIGGGGSVSVVMVAVG